MGSLYDFAKGDNPDLHLKHPIRHPTNDRKVIGHVGLDKGRGVRVATFPRQKSEHWFRGDSTSGLTGYGISESVLDNRLGSTERVLVIETDNSRVIEYERLAFSDATLVAYSPELDECVIGDDTMRIDDELFNDRQRVIPVDEARQVFDRDDVTIHE